VKAAGPAIAAAELLRAVLIAVAVIAGLALAAGAALVAYWVRRGRRSAPLVVHQARPVTQRAAEPLPGPQRRAIEAPRPEVHLHFHGVTAGEVAEILRQPQVHRPDDEQDVRPGQ
jgi:hypothetical protein